MEIENILVAARGNGVDQVAVELACKIGKKSKQIKRFPIKRSADKMNRMSSNQRF